MESSSRSSRGINDFHHSISIARYVEIRSVLRQSADDFLDVLQKLKIIPKDEVHIDLTHTPPPSPHIKREKVDDLIRKRDEKDEHNKNDLNGGAPSKNISGDDRARPSADLTTGTSDDARKSDEQRDKKRKAVQDELMEVELEQQRVMLEQKKLRLTKTLAEMD